MSNWWDNGIQGNEDSNNMPTSSGVILNYEGTPVNVMPGASIVGIIPLNQMPVPGGTYRTIITTTKRNTQVILDITDTTQTDVHVYHPEAYVTTHSFSAKLGLAKDDTSLFFGDGVGVGTLIAGSGDLQEYYRRRSAVTPTNEYKYLEAYPFNGHGDQQSIACIGTNSGLELWLVGYGGLMTAYDPDVLVENTVTRLGTIPSSALNNPFWFDPAGGDGLDAQQRDQSGTGDGRGTGQYDYPGDDIGFPGLPLNNVLSIANFRLYNPTGNQLATVLEKLWFTASSGSITEIIDAIKEIFESILRFLFKPKESLVAVMMYPFDVNSAGSYEVYLGNMDTGTTSALCTSQYQTVDCGTLNVPLKYASVLDYSPYQKAQLFIPFVGFRSINVDQIAGGSIAIKYNVDLLTGQALAMVRINNLGSNHSVLYTYDCNLAISVPISSDKYDSMMGGFMKTAALVAAGAAGGGIAAGAGMAAASAAKGAALAGVAQIPSAMDAIAGAHGVCDSGQLNMVTGAMGELTPFLVLEQVNQSLPAGYEAIEGYPSNISCSLGQLSGYTEVERVHLNIAATDEELNEIERLLTNGVIL